MHNEIIIQKQKIEYISRRFRRAKKLRIIIRSDASILVTKPWWISEAKVRNFLFQNSLWLINQLDKIKKKYKNHSSQADFIINKEKARKIVWERLEKFNKHYNFPIKKVSIRRQRSRWGSCSGLGGLSFNYQLVYLPDQLIDYLVVHELCHLREMNHSFRFWSLVSQTMPDYPNLKNQLKNFY